MILAILLLCAQAGSALANGYGLRGGIYDIVSDDDAYDAYIASADSGNEQVGDEHVNQAILSSRYHNQLIAAVRQGRVWTAETLSTTAVYQPGDARGERPALSHTSDGFILSYGSGERYTFRREGAQYVLTDVRFNVDSAYGDSLQWSEEGGYLFWESGAEDSWERIGDALWRTGELSLRHFNIAQLPRSIADVRRMNAVSSALRTDLGWLGAQEDFTGMKRGSKLAVYAAPDQKAYRAASGKASVSTGGDMRLYGEYDGWTMVEYAVSLRTSRIGFVNATLMSAPSPLALTEAPVALVTARDTFLTDDPNVSQFAQMALPAGTQVEGLAQFGAFYALVSVPGAGQPMWGFVPLRDLSVVGDTARWDVMERLIGKWQTSGGDPSIFILYADGSSRAIIKDADFNWLSDTSGQWRVTDCPADADYPGDPLYEIVFTGGDGAETRFGLHMNDDGSMTLQTSEGEATLHRTEYSTYGNG